jgi:SAM-dependent methyltransferase
VNDDVRRVLRSAVDRLPPRVQAPLRAAVATARAGASAPSTRTFEFPEDVADREALRAYLADTDLFGAATAEADGYLADALDRFRITMALLPPLAPGARVLELGSNPYFLTRLLLRRGYKVTSANYFGDQWREEPVQVVTAPGSGERHVFEFDHFNVERERFPYPDGSFDLVLFCEILEHLPSDPIQTFAEIHRVLAQPHGTMLLTTPNATRTVNLLRTMQGENPYEELSGYGTYGRHNREYTVAELRELLTSLRFDVEDVFAADIHDDVPAVPVAPGVSAADRGDNLFAVARPTGESRWHYPPWLYSSRHALRRVVSPEVRAGHNDEVQATGLHLAEVLDGAWGCWTAAEEAVFTVESPGGSGSVVVEGLAPPASVGRPVAVEIVVGEASSTHDVVCDGRPFVVRSAVSPSEGRVEVRLRAPTWVPAEVGQGADERRLGVVVRRVAVESSS